MMQFSYLNDIRLPLFLFAAADELPLSFFPLFTRSAENPLSWLDIGVVISLPLVGYLVAIMIGSPYARPFADRWGHRNLLLMAMAPAVVGHFGLALSANVLEIIFFRTLIGFGYAIATLAFQDYVLDLLAQGAARPFPRLRHGRPVRRHLRRHGPWRHSRRSAGRERRLLRQRRVGGDVGALSLSGSFRAASERGTGNPCGCRSRPRLRQSCATVGSWCCLAGIAIPANVLLQAFISLSRRPSAERIRRPPRPASRGR